MAYLDNSATTQPCRAAVEAMVRCMTEGFYNPSSVYRPAVDAFRAVRECRETLLKAVHGDGCDLYFTSGGTESNNLAILGAAAKKRGPRICAVSAVEHPSVREPFERLRAEGWDVRVIGVSEDGALRWDELERALDDGAALVSCMQVNNETGALLDAERLRRTVNGRALIHVDGVQGFLRVPFDMKNADLDTLSGHKIHGPKGIGALIARRGVRLSPRIEGGGQEKGLRSGTENTAGIAGFAAAAEWMLAQTERGEALRAAKLRLYARLRAEIPNLHVNGPDPEGKDAVPHILNLSLGVRGEVMLHALEAEGVYVGNGSACSTHKREMSAAFKAMRAEKQDAEMAVRFSLGMMNTTEEMDAAADAVIRCYKMYSAFQRR